MRTIMGMLARVGGPCLALLFAVASARATTMQLSTVAESGITIDLDAWADLNPATVAGRDFGLVAVVVTIDNQSAADRVWTIEPDRNFGPTAAGAIPVARVAVPAGGTGKTTVYVDPGHPATFGTTWLKVRGYGLNGGEQPFQVQAWSHSPGTGGTGKPPLPAAISRAAAEKARRLSIEAFQIQGGLTGLDMDRAPDDWRGWSIFSCVLLTESEWLAMPAGVRKALLDWVGLGGKAGLFVADPSAGRLDAIGLPAADADGRRRVGAGEIVALRWNGDEIEPAPVAEFLRGRTQHPQADLVKGYLDASTGDRWEAGFRALFDVFGPRLPPTLAILSFLAIFGLLAGPLNVMLFAGPGRRSRLFWTTPLISLAATACLLTLIFLRDGVGGAGARRMLGLLMPDRNGIAIIQEQFSRTGVLFSGAFPIREPSWMRPLGDVAAEVGFLEVDGRQREGDWFRSRSDQAHLLETVRPSRARIEFVPGDAGPPAVISSIEVPLDRVFVIDEDGAYWTAFDVGTGERKPLERSDFSAYAAWFDGIEADAGPVRKAALAAVRNRRGHAYADSARAAKAAVQTHGAIRWTDDKAAFMGPFTRAARR